MPRRSAPFEMVTSPIPEVSLQLLLTRPRLIQELNSDLERILLFAKKSSVNANEHAALDEEYIELLSDLYTSIAKHVVQNIKCDRGNSHCSGAARLSFEVCNFPFLVCFSHRINCLSSISFQKFYTAKDIKECCVYQF